MTRWVSLVAILVCLLSALLLVYAPWKLRPLVTHPTSLTTGWDGISEQDLAADPTLETLKNLKLQDLEKVKQNVNEASKLVQGIRLLDALQKLIEAEQLAPDLFHIHNLKGAVFTKMRLLEKARLSFERASRLHPSSFHPRFNLAETDFLHAAASARKGDPAAATQWGIAERAFKQLRKGSADDSTKKLIQFKVTICLLQQGKAAKASVMIGTFSYLDDEPIYYLSQAAKAFYEGDKPDAQSWIDSANRIYSPQAVTLYLDSFIELGWIDTLVNFPSSAPAPKSSRDA